MKILYFGTVCDLTAYEKLLQNSPVKPSVATIVFESALLEGFYRNRVDLEICSSPMIPYYRHSKLFYWGNKQEKLDCGYTCKWLKTWNILFLKQLSRRIDGRKLLKAWLEKNRGEECVVLSYGISPFLTKDILSLCRKYGAKSCAIVPDLPRDMFMNSRKHILRAWLRQQYLKPTLHRQGDYDCYVYLTEAMAEVIAPDKPYIVMEGILNTVSVNEEEGKKTTPRGIMYAGGLNEKYGILNLLDAFELADIPDAELWLFGDGNAVDAIRERAKMNPKIRLFGRRSREEVLTYEQKAALLVNPRSVREEYTKYSFPSKTIEYMYSGTPLLTTKLPGIPEEYFQYVFTAADNDVALLADALQKVFTLSEEELHCMGQNARAYVTEHKNAVVQARKVLDFLKIKER